MNTKRRFKVKSRRKQNHDYSEVGSYFVTICTKDMQQMFGKIQDIDMHKNESGEKVEEIWKLIPSKFPNVMIDQFVVMPNHIHGILIIVGDNSMEVRSDDSKVNEMMASSGRNVINLPAGRQVTSTTKQFSKGNAANIMSTGHLGEMIRWFKGRCTHEIRKLDPNFAWQANYHDRIVRNHKEYEKIARYIYYNPQKWKEDKYYKKLVKKYTNTSKNYR